jgi:hypothetical protein
MSEQTAQDYVNKQTRKEVEEADSEWVRRQRELDFWWAINLARKAEARQRRMEIPERGDYSPIARFDQEADDKQADADRAYARRLAR